MKKVVAAVAAVRVFLDQEKAAIASAVAPPKPCPTAWGISARRDMMRNRTLMQRRIVP